MKILGLSISHIIYIIASVALLVYYRKNPIVLVVTNIAVLLISILISSKVSFNVNYILCFVIVLGYSLYYDKDKRKEKVDELVDQNIMIYDEYGSENVDELKNKLCELENEIKNIKDELDSKRSTLSYYEEENKKEGKELDKLIKEYESKGVEQEIGASASASVGGSGEDLAAEKSSIQMEIKRYKRK